MYRIRKTRPYKRKCLLLVVLSIVLGSITTTGVAAATVEVTGVPGSPGATTTLDGKQLPPPPRQDSWRKN